MSLRKSVDNSCLASFVYFECFVVTSSVIRVIRLIRGPGILIRILEMRAVWERNHG